MKGPNQWKIAQMAVSKIPNANWETSPGNLARQNAGRPLERHPKLSGILFV